MKLAIKILFAVTMLATLCGSAFSKHNKQKPENVVEWKAVPAAAQTTIQNNLNGGKVAQVTKDVKNGVTIYRAEVKQSGGKTVKVSVTDSGTLLGVKEEKNKRKHKPLFGG